MKSYIAKKKAAEVDFNSLCHVQKKKNASTDHTGSGERRGFADVDRDDKVNVSMKDQRAPPPMNVASAASNSCLDEDDTLPLHLPSVPLLPGGGAQFQSVCRRAVGTLPPRRTLEARDAEQSVHELHQGPFVAIA